MWELDKNQYRRVISENGNHRDELYYCPSLHMIILLIIKLCARSVKTKSLVVSELKRWESQNG